MRHLRTFVLWTGLLQAVIFSCSLILISRAVHWSANLKESAITVAKGEATLETLSAGVEMAGELREAKKYGKALAEFNMSTTASLKAENGATLSYLSAANATILVVAGASIISAFLAIKLLFVSAKTNLPEPSSD